MMEFDQLGRFYYEEIKKKMDADKVQLNQISDEARSIVTSDTLNNIKETIEILE